MDKKRKAKQDGPATGVRGLRILSILVGLASLILLDVALFASVNSQYKYRLYRVQLGAFIQVLLYFMSCYIWRRLTVLVTQNRFLETVWKIFLAVFIALSHLGPFFTFYNTKEPTALGCIAWICCAFELLHFTMLSLVELFTAALTSAKYGDSTTAVLCKSYGCRWMCFFFTLLYVSVAYYNAVSPPIVIRHTVPIARLPPSMNGITIALLSDIHLGPTVGFTMMETAVKITNSLKPDIVILAGDLTDGTVDELKEAALPLKDISAPYGAFFVTGNHEYYTSDVENWFEFVKSMGFHVLHNSNYKVHSKDGKNDWFCIFGTDDRQAEIIGYDGHSVNLTKAFSGCDDKHAAILVTHQPNIAKRSLKMGFPTQLILSGHTHAGQIFPFSIPVYLANAFYAGLYHYDTDRYVYVSQGTYFYGWPLRSGSHNEITKITLKSV